MKKEHLAILPSVVIVLIIGAVAAYFVWNQQSVDVNSYEGDGFTFEYPAELVADEKGLWTEEGYDRFLDPPEGCSICSVPYLAIRTGTVELDLEQYILGDLGMTSYDFQSIAQFDVYPQELALGDHEFTKVTSQDMREVTTYYVENDGLVYAFMAYDLYWDVDQTDEVTSWLSTLQF